MTEEERSFVKAVFGDNERKPIISNDLCLKKAEEQRAWEEFRDKKKAEEEQMLQNARDYNYHIPTEKIKDLIPEVQKHLKDNEKHLEGKLTIGRDKVGVGDFVYMPEEKDLCEITQHSNNDLLGLKDCAEKELAEKLEKTREKFTRYSQLSAEEYRPESAYSYKQLASEQAMLIEMIEQEMARRTAMQ